MLLLWRALLAFAVPTIFRLNELDRRAFLQACRILAKCPFSPGISTVDLAFPSFVVQACSAPPYRFGRDHDASRLHSCNFVAWSPFIKVRHTINSANSRFFWRALCSAVEISVGAFLERKALCVYRESTIVTTIARTSTHTPTILVVGKAGWAFPLAHTIHRAIAYLSGWAYLASIHAVLADQRSP